MIDENPKRPSQRQTHLFSLPIYSKAEHSSTHRRVKLPKRKPLQSQTPQKLSTSQPSPTTPPKTVKPRQISLPPSFPSSVHNTRPKSRKVCTPAPYPPIRGTPTSLFGSLRPPSRKPSSQVVSPTDALGLNSLPGLCAPHSSYLQPDLLPDSTTLTPQHSPASSAGPTTPPTSSHELFSEPIVVSSASAITPSLETFTNPFTHFQLECDSFSKVPVVPYLDYAGPTPGLTTDDFSPMTTCGFFQNHEWALPNLMPSLLPPRFAYDPFVAQVVS